MTAAERQRLRRLVSEARRAATRFAPDLKVDEIPTQRPEPTPEERARRAAREKAWKSREPELVASLDGWQWEAA